MAKQLFQLDTADSIPASAYIILNKLTSGDNLDYKVEVGTMLSPYVHRANEVGNEIGKIPKLVDIGGNPALPALDGSQLTNITFVSGTGSIEGGVRLSDSTNSTSGVSEGFAATPKAVRDSALNKLDTSGGTLSGNLTFNNNVGVLGKNTTGDVVTLLKINTSNHLNIGAIGAVPINTVNLATGNLLNITDENGVTKFSFNVDTGTVTGFSAAGISAAATSTTLAGTVQTALAELSTEKLDKTGGTLTGNLTLNNGIKVLLGIYPMYYNSGTSALRIGDSTTKPANIELTASSLISLKNTAGTSIFTFNVSTGASTGIKATDVTFTPTGTISSTNVQAAIAELGTEKLATGSTAYNSDRLGGTLAASYLLSATAASTYLGVNATAYNSSRLGNVLSSEFRTKAQNDALYLGINSTATNSSQLGGVPAASYLTTTAGNAAYLGKTAVAADSSKLGGVVASAYLTESYADTKYATISGSTADNALNLGGVPASAYLTEAEAAGIYLTVGGTAYSAARLGGTLASAYQTTSQADTKYLAAAGTAVNSNQLGGTDSSHFPRLATANTFTNAMTVNARLTPNVLTMQDTRKIEFGNSVDAELYYDTSNSSIKLNLRSGSGINAGSFRIVDNGVTRFTFDRATGDFTATGNITSTSDIRVKDKLQVIEEPLEKIKSLTGFTYDRTDINTKRQVGLVAQDVLSVLPEAVSEDSEGMLSINYGNLAGLFVEAIKELQNEVKELRGIIDDLTS